MRKVPFEVVQIDYQWTNEHIKLLTDIRFRLLAIFSPLVGVAVTLLSSQSFGTIQTSVTGTTQTSPALSGAATVLTAAIGLLGFVVTFGVVLYDLRNSQLYNALVHRAKVLEGVLGCVGSGEETMFKPPSVAQKREPLPDAREETQEPKLPRRIAAQGGLHSQRAKRYGRLLGAEISHSGGLSWIYAALLASWMFPVFKALGVLVANVEQPHFWNEWQNSPEVALKTSVVAAVVSVGAFFLFRHLYYRMDSGGIAKLLGYRDRNPADWERDYDLVAELYDIPEQKRERKQDAATKKLKLREVVKEWRGAKRAQAATSPAKR